MCSIAINSVQFVIWLLSLAFPLIPYVIPHDSTEKSSEKPSTRLAAIQQRYLSLGTTTEFRSRVLYRKLIFKTQELFTTLLAALTEHFTPMEITVLFDHPETFITLSGLSVEEASKRGMDFEWLHPVISTDNVVFGPPTTTTPPNPASSPVRIKQARKAVLYSNHQTYLDWWLIWQLAYHYNHHGHLRIVLKDTLKAIPIFGWGMSFFEFIFLNRKWSVDKDRLHKCLQTVTGMDATLPLWLLIFPEGTILDANTRGISKRYAEKVGLEFPFKHTIMPKSTGLLYILRQLTNPNQSYNPQTDLAVYDVTLAYPVRSQSKEPECTDRITFPTLDYTLGSVFFQRQGPRKFHLIIRKCNFIDGVTPSADSSEDAEFTEWLRDRYLEKDHMLAQYYHEIHQQMDKGTWKPRGSIQGPDHLFHDGFSKNLLIPTIKNGKQVATSHPTLGQTIQVGPTWFDSFALLTVTILVFRAWFYVIYLIGITWTWTGLIALIFTLLSVVTGALIYTNVLKLAPVHQLKQ